MSDKKDIIVIDDSDMVEFMEWFSSENEELDRLLIKKLIDDERELEG